MLRTFTELPYFLSNLLEGLLRDSALYENLLLGVLLIFIYIKWYYINTEGSVVVIAILPVLFYIKLFKWFFLVNFLIEKFNLIYNRVDWNFNNYDNNMLTINIFYNLKGNESISGNFIKSIEVK